MMFSRHLHLVRLPSQCSFRRTLPKTKTWTRHSKTTGTSSCAASGCGTSHVTNPSLSAPTVVPLRSPHPRAQGRKQGLVNRRRCLERHSMPLTARQPLSAPSTSSSHHQDAMASFGWVPHGPWSPATAVADILTRVGRPRSFVSLGVCLVGSPCLCQTSPFHPHEVERLSGTLVGGVSWVMGGRSCRGVTGQPTGSSLRRVDALRQQQLGRGLGNARGCGIP